MDNTNISNTKRANRLLSLATLFGLLVLAAIACTGGGRKVIKGTWTWKNGIEVEWTWKRTDQTRETAERGVVTECLARGVMTNTGSKDVKVTAVRLIILDRDGMELAKIPRYNSRDVDVALAPGETYEVQMSSEAPDNLIKLAWKLEPQLWSEEP